MDSFDCSYGKGAFDDLGIMAGGKDLFPPALPKDMLVEIVVATRTGFPFAVCMVATCVTIFFCIFKLLRACGTCLPKLGRYIRRKCGRPTAAREADALAREHSGTLIEIRKPLLG